MELVYKQAKTQWELQQILQLQQRNLLQNVSLEEKKNEGFVTVKHTLELLQEMNDVCGHVIAVDGANLAGYALCMHPSFSKRIAVLEPMFTQIEAIVPKDRKFMVMGQVCVDKAYRGKGIFRGLYAFMQGILSTDFDEIITEVDTANSRSVEAHKAVGFTELYRYSSGGQNWQLIRLATK